MLDVWTNLPLFPSNGLDRSLHAPVFVGLMLLSIFRETLGWSYVGLVVPGYLAAVFIAAPLTGLLVVAESILAYVVANWVGRVMPRTGVWFTFFGRERFLLLIVVASFVRLFIEGAVLPRVTEHLALNHSRELYSLGLVLVPLLANSYWSIGIVRGLPRMAVVSGLTYLVVAELLLRYTNFTVSRFQVANESVSLAFLESPHAHIILLIGAIIAARNNVRYGWDYNGILVPALLAVAWYQPTKVAATIGEGLLVYWCSRLLVRLPPLSWFNIVAGRRLVVAFSTGLVIKFVSGYLLERYLPTVQMIDYFGFGYLLPSLLAVKIWDKQGAAQVIIPTLQVSLTAFIVGNVIGFGLRLVDPPALVRAEAREEEVGPRSVPMALMLGDSAPLPQRSGLRFEDESAYALTGNYIFGLYAGEEGASLAELEAQGMRAKRAEQDWLVVAPGAADANEDIVGPRLAVKRPNAYSRPWLVLVEGGEPGGSSTVLGYDMAEFLGARALVLSSRINVIAERDNTLALSLRQGLQLDQVLIVSIDEGRDGAHLSLVGEVAAELSSKRLAAHLGDAVAIEFRPFVDSEKSFVNAARLSMPRVLAERIAARRLGEVSLGTWGAFGFPELRNRISTLVDSKEASYRKPTIAELRLFGTGVMLPRLSNASAPPSAWRRSLASQLGYRFASLSVGEEQFWACYEPVSRNRRGQATFIQRRAPSSSAILVGVPAPRWEQGSLSAGLTLFAAVGADALLVHGALSNTLSDGSADPRRPQGRRSHYQRIHELWLNEGGHSLLLRAVSDHQQLTSRSVITFDSELSSLLEAPDWSLGLFAFLRANAISLAPFDGSAERAGFSASLDPAMAYARRFAPGRAATLWLDGPLRQTLNRTGGSGITRARLSRMGLEPEPYALKAEIERLQGCFQLVATCPALPTEKCDARAVLGAVAQYHQSKNPYQLSYAMSLAGECAGTVFQDPSTQVTWLSLVSTKPSVFLVPLSRPPLAVEPLVLSSVAEVERFGFAALRPLELISQ